MPLVVRLADLSTGHFPFAARPNIEASPNVFANNKGVHRVGDAWAVHCAPVCHGGVQATGSPNVFANNKPVARVGDAISCGDVNATGSPNVIAN